MWNSGFSKLWRIYFISKLGSGPEIFSRVIRFSSVGNFKFVYNASIELFLVLLIFLRDFRIIFFLK